MDLTHIMARDKTGKKNTPTMLVKKISIVSGCFNEVWNVAELVARVAKLMANLWKYEYELFQVASSSLL